MLIAGFQKLTLLDYPGKIAALIFTPGCMWRCGYCQNPELVLPAKIRATKFIPETNILAHLQKRRGLIDGLAITGGEPTLQPDLINFIQNVKSAGFLIKLDTNGTHPEILAKLFQKNLIDYLAMDIKTAPQYYSKLVCREVNITALDKSITLIKNSAVPYEFRSTIIPGHHSAEIMHQIGNWIQGARNYYLQQFQNRLTLDPKFQKKIPLPQKCLEEYARIMKQYLSNVVIRN